MLDTLALPGPDLIKVLDKLALLHLLVTTLFLQSLLCLLCLKIGLNLVLLLGLTLIDCFSQILQRFIRNRAQDLADLIIDQFSLLLVFRPTYLLNLHLISPIVLPLKQLAFYLLITDFFERLEPELQLIFATANTFHIRCGHLGRHDRLWMLALVDIVVDLV